MPSRPRMLQLTATVASLAVTAAAVVAVAHALPSEPSGSSTALVSGGRGAVAAAPPQNRAGPVLIEGSAQKAAAPPAADLAAQAQRRALALARINAKATARARQQAAAARSFSFDIASFNILGSNHTRPGADADEYAPGRIRTEWAADEIRMRGLDIIGFSEIQRDQLSVFVRTTQGRFDVWPGTTYGAPGIPASVVWRKDMFTAVSKSTITIPFVGQQRLMPVVRLREKTTGREFYVINAHNSPNDLQAERDEALRIEIAKIRELRSEQRVPVFFVGDLNEKTNALCKVTTQTDLVAASPTGNLSGCTGWRGMRLDWVFGSNVTFTGYTQDRSRLVRQITDHAVVFARATVS